MDDPKVVWPEITYSESDGWYRVWCPTCGEYVVVLWPTKLRCRCVREWDEAAWRRHFGEMTEAFT